MTKCKISNGSIQNDCLCGCSVVCGGCSISVGLKGMKEHATKCVCSLKNQKESHFHCDFKIKLTISIEELRENSSEPRYRLLFGEMNDIAHNDWGNTDLQLIARRSVLSQTFKDVIYKRRKQDKTTTARLLASSEESVSRVFLFVN